LSIAIGGSPFHHYGPAHKIPDSPGIPLCLDQEITAVSPRMQVNALLPAECVGHAHDFPTVAFQMFRHGSHHVAFPEPVEGSIAGHVSSSSGLRTLRSGTIMNVCCLRLPPPSRTTGPKLSSLHRECSAVGVRTLCIVTSLYDACRTYLKVQVRSYRVLASTRST
jgi:hypothetical protein